MEPPPGPPASCAATRKTMGRSGIYVIIEPHWRLLRGLHDHKPVLVYGPCRCRCPALRSAVRTRWPAGSVERIVTRTGNSHTRDTRSWLLLFSNWVSIVALQMRWLLPQPTDRCIPSVLPWPGSICGMSVDGVAIIRNVRPRRTLAASCQR